jgi:hypothetical protein
MYRIHLQGHATRMFLARLIFEPETGSGTFLRNVGSHTEYAVLYLTTWQHSIQRISPTRKLLCNHLMCLFIACTGYVYEPRWLSRYSDCLRAERPRGQSSSHGSVKNFLISTLSSPVLELLSILLSMGNKAARV